VSVKVQYLRSKVGPGNENRCDLVADNLVNPLQVLQADLALAFKDSVQVIAARRRGDVPLFDVANSFGVLQSGSGNVCNVPEPGAAEIPQDGFIRLGVKPLCFTLEVLRILIGDGPELFEVILDIQASTRSSPLATVTSAARLLQPTPRFRTGATSSTTPPSPRPSATGWWKTRRSFNPS
jgi:hypothetical protein